MIDVSRHFNSINTTDRAGAPIFKVLALSGERYRGLYSAKIIADLKQQTACHSRGDRNSLRVELVSRAQGQHKRLLDEVNAKVDCLAQQGGGL
jgi:hypothetical protein